MSANHESHGEVTRRWWHCMVGAARWLKTSASPRPIDVDVVRALIDELPLFDHLDDTQVDLLMTRTLEVLSTKQFIGADGFDVDDHVRAIIALQLALPVLHLGVDWYCDWRSVIIYPDEFVAERDVIDSHGLVHSVTESLVGEAWERGPLVLSWNDVLHRGDGCNVVIHECAHKLDLLNGEDNGFPPLHAEMDRAWWSRVFELSFTDFCQRVDAGRSVPFDDYAAHSPGEFFAVVTEVFFEMPRALFESYPGVYRQLVQFYRQDPLRR